MNLSDDFIDALLADFEQHGAATIRRVAKEYPADYLRFMASTVPAQVGIERETSSEAEIDSQVLMAALAVVLKN